MKCDTELSLALISESMDERLTQEPELRVRLASADNWMHQYIADYLDQQGSSWIVLHKMFQCEVHQLDADELSAIVNTLKKLTLMDWSGLFADKDMDCKELASESGKYTLRVSEWHRAIVGRHDSRAFFLCLVSYPSHHHRCASEAVS